MNSLSGRAALGYFAAAALLGLGQAASGSVPAPSESRGGQVDRIVREQMAARHIPGLQVAVVQHGRIVLLRCYGVANLQTPVPVTDNTVFSVNSIAKAFTGVEAVKLVRAGKLRLDAPVSEYLGDLPVSWRRPTIRQLLAHMSGLPDIDSAPGFMDPRVSEDTIWKWVRSRPVTVPPGERFSYSQTNYTLLLNVINKLNGRPPESELGWPQFQAAGMTHSRYGDSTELIPNGAAGYIFSYASPGAAGVLHPVFELFRPFFRASSGLYTTAEDLATWIIALRDGRILDPEGLALLWTPVRFNSGKAGEWALGWEVLNRPGHRAAGMTGGGRAAFFIYPDDDLGVVILTSLAGASPEDFIDEIAAVYGLPLTGVPALRAELEKQGFRNGPAAAEAMIRTNPRETFSEAELNDWGYRLLSTGRPREALEVLKIVPALYPSSGNAYDSLGEAYAANGDRSAAIAAYRRSLALDPRNGNAVRWIRRLESAP